MMKKKVAFAVAVLMLIQAGSVLSAAVVRRFAIVAGANRGGVTRTTLRYAVSDAESFAQVLKELAGVAPPDCRLLREPSLEDFTATLESVRLEIEKSRTEASRVELILYYSGHADESGLMLGSGRLPYEKIREEMAELKADVNLAVLDACASGAITRLKGGVRYPAFLLHSPASMKGYAFLTSSSDNETAQESDRIKASFFTYYLISALRGAADSSGDGRVSLNEAYEFSYNETLGRTAKTQGGAQHPAYDIQMAGTGEMVITDVREMSASLIFPEELSGRLFVMDSKKQLIAELFKPQGRRTELALEAGTYIVYLDAGPQFLAASVKLGENQTVLLDRTLFAPTRKEPSVLRGPSVYSPPAPILVKRSRFELLSNPYYGDWGAAYSYGVRENLSLRFSAVRMDHGTRTFGSNVTFYDTSATSYALLFGARYYPTKKLGHAIRPYLWSGYGPVVLRQYTQQWINPPSFRVTESYLSSTEFCFQPGGGADFFLGRRFVATVHAGYNIMPALPLPENRKWQVNLGFSVLIGKGEKNK